MYHNILLNIMYASSILIAGIIIVTLIVDMFGGDK